MNNVIILGSGRSGTSMISGVLSENKFHLGENYDYLKHRDANPKGFFEDSTINNINEMIITHSVPKLFQKLNFIFPQFTSRGFRWLGRIPLWLPIRSNDKIDQKIKSVIQRKNFCYKDPRFSFTLPIWKRHFDSNVKFLVIYRNPSQTVESILREYKESGIENKVKMNYGMALKLWQNIYSHILKNYYKSSNQSNWLFFHYDQVFHQDFQIKLSVFLETELDFSFADDSLSRTSKENCIEDSNVEKLYKKLNNLSSHNPIPG